MKNKAPLLKGENVLLRQPVERDVLDYLKVEGSEELNKMYGFNTGTPLSKTLEDAKQFVEAIQNNELEWCVEYEGRMIGQARLVVNSTDNRARYAVGLFDPTVWGKGLGTEITKLVLTYAFTTLQLHRIDLRVLSYNERAIRCYEKCGFIQEGMEREGSLINGRYETDIIMSILNREFT